MSALTPRKMKEIDDQIRELKKKRSPKVFLTVFCDVKSLEDTFVIPQKIMDSIYKLKDVESVSYTDNSNVISVMAQWNEFEVDAKVEKIKSIPNVVKVTASILHPRF
jgi:cell division protein FtsX